MEGIAGILTDCPDTQRLPRHIGCKRSHISLFLPGARPASHGGIKCALNMFQWPRLPGNLNYKTGKLLKIRSRIVQNGPKPCVFSASLLRQDAFQGRNVPRPDWSVKRHGFVEHALHVCHGRSVPGPDRLVEVPGQVEHVPHIWL